MHIKAKKQALKSQAHFPTADNCFVELGIFEFRIEMFIIRLYAIAALLR